ncbi:DUF4142 domain-containing protein [Hymenobacter jeollabukensis]|uniref:DUF4142 domain-containing protein n=1 Tax=Hymenobacter jeollabukensis TaxID=2025313 RepID=A0A5R8WU69_9BACT|nr:DUF4142 domain-containing protein [Hymenobacter jeollabukensis]TLM95287.1 DUF4142 domain-containing protein [Hymenobacter jeollabukensis]
MHSFTLAAVAALALSSLGACSGNKDPQETAQEQNEVKNDAATPSTEMGKVEEKKMDFDSEFLTKAASGGMLEVELGKLVSQKGVSAEAKQFAQHMVTDHTKANEELKAIAARKNITLPDGLADDHKDVYDDVADEKGLDMDKKYLKEMQKDHEEDVKEFTEASVKASDPDIKAFATKTLPTLKMHLDMVNKDLPKVEAMK